VTQQQALTEVVGDMNHSQEKTSLKISGAVSNRMPLNSADVAEVKSKALLTKTQDARSGLGTLHDREERNCPAWLECALAVIRIHRSAVVRPSEVFIRV